jgi:hypothetical protein
VRTSPETRAAAGAAPHAPRVQRLWRWLSVAFAILFFALPTRPARAQDHAGDAVVQTPRDVPIVVPSQAVTVPPVPASFPQKDLGWLRIAYSPAAHERVQPLLRDAEEIKAQLADALGQPVLDHVDVRIARSYEEMETLGPSDVKLTANASGIAFPGLHLILLTLTEPVSSEATDLGEVFRHELAHIALEDAVKGQHVPTWFNEGLAINLSGENPFKRRGTLWNATLAKTVIPLGDLDRSFPETNYEQSVAYAESGDFVRYLLRDGDRARFAAVVERTRKGEPFERSLSDAYGTDLRKLEFQWREDIAKRYTFLPVLTGGSLVWVLVIGAMAVGWVKKRKRERATLERWEREEALADEAARRAERAAAMELADAAAMRNVPSLPKIEHEGSWHTIH